MDAPTHSSNAAELQRQYDALSSEEPNLRIRDAADRLGVSEAQLLALRCGDGVVRLEATGWKNFLPRLRDLGTAMVLTRNDACVSEVTGTYDNISVFGDGAMGLTTGPIDLRLFLSQWKIAFAVENKGRDGQVLRSFQFFDAAGTALHKVYLRDTDKLSVYENLRGEWRASDQSREQPVDTSATPEQPSTAPLSDEQRRTLLDGWASLEDTHDFHPLLKQAGVSRIQAMHAAEGFFTQRVSNAVAREVLERARHAEAPIMIFVGNHGAIQIYTGTVQRLRAVNDWFNVLDDAFNLHLYEPAIADCWAVKKPTKDGNIHSIEAYDEHGELIVQFFGARKPGVPERQDWQSIWSSITD